MSPHFCETVCLALRVGREEAVLSLLKAGHFDVHYRSSRDQTALHIAPEVLLHKVTTRLLEKGADPNARDQLGRTPAICAARSGDLKSLHSLMQHGANLELATYKMNWTPLMWAARNGQLDIIQALLEADVDPRCEAANGDTALAIARRYNHAPTARALFKVT